MKYFFVEEERIVKPLYKSNFPLIKQQKWGQPSARLVKQFKFRKTLRLFVDDVETYRSLGGQFGSKKVERFRVSDYPTWSQLAGISTFFLPEFRPAPIIKGGNSSNCYLITDIVHNNDLVTVQSEFLEKSNSSEGLTEVTSVFCDYTKSWSVTIDKDSAEQDGFRAKKWFKSRVRECNIKSRQSAYDLIDRILDANSNDSGIVRKSKAYDYVQFRCIAQEMFKIKAYEDDESNDYGFYLRDDIWEAAKSLYGLQGDYSYYDVYDDTLISQLVATLHSLTKEADELSLGLHYRTIELNWAKAKMKELRSELNEAGFPFNQRGDTEYHWNRFNDIYKTIVE